MACYQRCSNAHSDASILPESAGRCISTFQNVRYLYISDLFDRTKSVLFLDVTVTAVYATSTLLAGYLGIAGYAKGCHSRTLPFGPIPAVTKGMKCSARTAQRDLDALKAQGKIRFEGSPKTGHYCLNS